MLVTDAFVATTVIAGGILLVAGLEADRLPLDWLGGTPFDGYAAPGLILAVVVGGAIMMGWVVG